MRMSMHIKTRPWNLSRHRKWSADAKWNSKLGIEICIGIKVKWAWHVIEKTQFQIRVGIQITTSQVRVDKGTWLWKSQSTSKRSLRDIFDRKEPMEDQMQMQTTKDITKNVPNDFSYRNRVCKWEIEDNAIKNAFHLFEVRLTRQKRSQRKIFLETERKDPCRLNSTSQFRSVHSSAYLHRVRHWARNLKTLICFPVQVCLSRQDDVSICIDFALPLACFFSSPWVNEFSEWPNSLTRSGRTISLLLLATAPHLYSLSFFKSGQSRKVLLSF